MIENLHMRLLLKKILNTIATRADRYFKEVLVPLCWSFSQVAIWAIIMNSSIVLFAVIVDLFESIARWGIRATIIDLLNALYANIVILFEFIVKLFIIPCYNPVDGQLEALGLHSFEDIVIKDCLNPDAVAVLLVLLLYILPVFLHWAKGEKVDSSVSKDVLLIGQLFAWCTVSFLQQVVYAVVLTKWPKGLPMYSGAALHDLNTYISSQCYILGASCMVAVLVGSRFYYLLIISTEKDGREEFWESVMGIDSQYKILNIRASTILFWLATFWYVLVVACLPMAIVAHLNNVETAKYAVHTLSRWATLIAKKKVVVSSEQITGIADIYRQLEAALMEITHLPWVALLAVLASLVCTIYYCVLFAARKQKRSH